MRGPAPSLVVNVLRIGPADSVLGVWYADGPTRDWLAFLAVVGGRIRAIHRFRYRPNLPPEYVVLNLKARAYRALDAGADGPARRAGTVKAFDSFADLMANCRYRVSRFGGGTPEATKEWLLDQPWIAGLGLGLRLSR